jgi:SAM-dependent methyltransferase
MRMPSLAEQRDYWDERWRRQAAPNQYQLERGKVVLTIIRSLRLVDPAILDFGCGTGWFTAELASVGRPTGIDISPAAIAYASARYRTIPFQAANLFTTPFSASQFDVVVSQEVLPHVEDPEAYLDIIGRILKPGGYLVITAANRFVMERWNHGGPDPDAHLKFYLNRGEFRRTLRRRFEVISTSSIIPVGDKGILRLVNSHKVNRVLCWMISERWVHRLRDWAGFGYTLVALARKP